MIYIDPPYNTGKDFVYNDKFSQDRDEFEKISGFRDEENNLLVDPFVRNTERNGRFHTDWLNMIFPRLKVARDLLKDNGVIFISIDDHEIENLKKVCNEIFGEKNFVATLNWKGRGGRQDSKYYAVIHEYILCYAKDISKFEAGTAIKEADNYPYFDEKKRRYYKKQLLRKWGSNSLRQDRPNLYYAIKAPDGTDVYPTIFEKTSKTISKPHHIQGRWRHGHNTLEKMLSEGLVEFCKTKWGDWVPYEKIYEPLPGEDKTKKFTTWIDDVSNGTETLKDLFGINPFDYAKSPELIETFLRMAEVEGDDIVLDFFSGSATTAHAVMKLNAEDGAKRKFIMVQLPEITAEGTEARKAGFRTICEIGEERIRLAAKKIKNDVNTTTKNLDLGFRVLKVDTSNMEDAFYVPEDINNQAFLDVIDNVKPDRTSLDLLFQIMPELNIELSAKIEKRKINDKEVFIVNEGYLIATFDMNIHEDVITKIAQIKPTYFVMRDASVATDNVLDNFDQIFRHYSSNTVRKIL